MAKVRRPVAIMKVLVQEEWISVKPQAHYQKGSCLIPMGKYYKGTYGDVCKQEWNKKIT